MNPDIAQFEQIIESILENGYGILDNFLNEKVVDNLIVSLNQNYHLGLFSKAKIGKKVEEKIEAEIRGDEILWLNPTETESPQNIFFRKIDSFSNYLNQTCYLGINDAEFHFAKYPKGKFYKRHRDSFLTKKGRILSVIFYLNQNWKPEDGGQLIIYKTENGIESKTIVDPMAGRIVCFESEKLDHEVLETFVDRLSITGWLLKI